MSIKETNKGRPKRDGILELPRTPIKALRFAANDPQELPGKHTCSAITHRDYSKDKNGKHEIDYIPQIRHYLITFHDLERRQKIYTLVHESKASSATLPGVGGQEA